MTWKHTNVALPGSAVHIHGAAGALARHIQAYLESACSRLGAVADRAQYPQGELTGEAAALAGLRAELDQLLVIGQCLVVTPYQHGVGQLQGEQYSLAAPNAVAALANKLQDGADANCPSGPLHALAWLVTGNSAEELARALTPLCDILPLPEWCAALRRLTASNDLMGQPAAATVPRWKASEPLQWDPLRSCRSLLGAEIARLESLASAERSPIDKLQALAGRRTARLEELNAAIDALSQVNGQIWCWRGHGDPASLAAQLQDSAPPDHSHSMTVAALLLSSSPLTFWQEMTP